MDTESVLIHVEAEASDTEGVSLTPVTPTNKLSMLSASTPSLWATPSTGVDAEVDTEVTTAGRSFPSPTTLRNELSVLSASTPSVWSTPNALDNSEKIHSFREIISMPTLKIERLPNGQLHNEESSARGTNSCVTLETLKESETDVCEVSIHKLEAMNKMVPHEKSDAVNEDDLLKPTPDCDQSMSPLSTHMAAPPNTPQIVVDVTVLSSESSNITVYEQTPHGVDLKGHSRSSSGVKIVGAIEKITQTYIEVSEKVDVVPEAVEKGSNRAYIPSEENAVNEEPVKLVDIAGCSATPFVPEEGAPATCVVEENPIGAVNGPTQSAGGTNENSSNGRSHTVDGFVDDSERLVDEGPHCEELLGALLVRPCPSMRPYRKTIAKIFVIGLLVVTVAFVILMIMVNRSLTM